jgi:hypothetical protein
MIFFAALCLGASFVAALSLNAMPTEIERAVRDGNPPKER